MLKKFQPILNIISIILKILTLPVFLYLSVVVKEINTFVSNNEGIAISIIFIGICYLFFEVIGIKKKVNKLIIEEVDIISDEAVKFVGSTYDKSLIKNVNAQISEFIHTEWLFSNKHYDRLKGSHWIAHTKRIEEEEAENGGKYIFSKGFNFDTNKNKIKSAELFFVVDDYCKIYLNGKELRSDRIEGNRELHNIDVKQFIVNGDNELQIEVENVEMGKILKEQGHIDHDFFKSKEKYKMNPYGVRFCLTIKYIKE